MPVEVESPLSRSLSSYRSVNAPIMSHVESDGECKPFATEDDVKDLMKRLYGFTVSKVKVVAGFDDQNFHIWVEEEHSNPTVEAASKTGYVLKIINTNDTVGGKTQLEGQIAMLEHLSKRGIVCPQHIPDISNSMHSDQPVPNRERTGAKIHTVKVLGYIAGQIVSTAKANEQLLRSTGAYLAEIHNGLADFFEECLNRDDYQWNLYNLAMIRPHVSILHDQELIDTVNRIIDSWSAVQKKFERMEYGSTHGDFNQFNILIESDSTTNYWVTGVLDFGDTSNGYKICDLGIHIAHMMTHCHTYIDLLDITKFCLQGYLSTRSLSDEELQVLYDCVCGRLAMIAVMTQYYYSIQPDPYQIQLTKPACECLKRLWQKSAADALQYWLK